jgi:hypothetical protein
MNIPIPVIAVVADVLSMRYSHSRLDYLMEQAGIDGDPPPGNKADKTRAWLKRANADGVKDPFGLLGKVLEEFMEVDSAGYGVPTEISPDRERVNAKLAEYGLAYVSGGHVVRATVGAVSRGLEQIIRDRDLAGIQAEFERIFKNIESDPPAAVTASCALLESLFKIYIADEQLEMPSDESIGPLWKVVRKHLSFDPASMQDEDLRKMLSGLASIVDGTGGLRTHKSSAHGHGHKVYKLKPRHARLAAHAAFTLATFVLETWAERTGTSKGE